MIISKNYEGTECVLVDIETGEFIREGDMRKAVSDKRPLRISGGRAPHKPESEGFVYVGDFTRFYASVVGARWKTMA